MTYAELAPAAQSLFQAYAAHREAILRGGKYDVQSAKRELAAVLPATPFPAYLAATDAFEACRNIGRIARRSVEA